jgi:imidazoleglycerol-phosphate dehydratase/histidinol-phosphatase
MKKVIFIDRDGTIIKEPPVTEQVDSIELVEFLPNVILSLKSIVKENNYELVMVTNQDGLGTESFPEETFWGPHNFMLKVLESEGIVFDDILIDRTFPHQNMETRKPGTGLLVKYMRGDYDLENSFVIGDRESDIQLARNIGAKGIFIGDESVLESMDSVILSTKDWNKILEYYRKLNRKSRLIRKTSETNIQVELNIDGSGISEINSGIGFFDHMLEQISRHAGFDLNVSCVGDLHIDEHHSIEDTAICLGQAVKDALGKKTGIQRYGFCLPMDECLIITAVDFGGRPDFKWEVDPLTEDIGGIKSEMFKHFFKSFSDSALCNLHIIAKGENSHHLIEGIFKSFAKTLKSASKKEEGNFELPSTKGSL